MEVLLCVSIEALLHRFDLEDCKPIATPMEKGLHLSIHDAREAIGRLIYVCISRPDI